MSSFQATLRTAAKNAVDSAMSSYVLTDGRTEETYFPQEKLENLGAKPVFKFVSLGITTERIRELRSPEHILITVPVQVAIQQRVTPTNTAYIDKLVELSEQVMSTLEDDELVVGEDYNWQRTEPLKDENGLIYSYQDLFNKGVFNVIFTCHYTYIIQP